MLRKLKTNGKPSIKQLEVVSFASYRGGGSHEG